MIRSIDTPQDIEAVLALWQQAGLALTPGQDWDQEIQWVAQQLLPQSQTWLYEQEGIQGFITTEQRQVKALCVSNTARGKGIGKALLAYAQSRCPQLEVQLMTSAQDGHSYFKQQGFHPVRELLDSRTGQFLLHMAPRKAGSYFSY
ncbi:GNAT family N-acetyltransferase [Gallaecimonas xiamenensis]|uniref:GCN5-like N-acetyltransferase n=1 Tax=Gallaecimonas xiamenensis 3-C-1 TaxID=745411 RepID=K2JRR7_9GAMM|nr:GNAT family N-acetyltransferase [Gallaecimonas xiamenensis]EKE77162.1 GCN5-like N-acetyltransferase [Gallaecimonas xiamenensis 3-C-1]